MSFYELLLLSLSLCFDTLAVSVAAGLQCRTAGWGLRLRYMGLLALCQTLMPALGWLVGQGLAVFMGAYGRWMALLMLCFVGGRMIREALSPDDTCQTVSNPFSVKNSVLVGLATSLDALAVGVSLAMVQARMWLASSLFFSSTALVALAGLLLGRSLGRYASGKAAVLGGIVLILIGLKIAFL